MKTEEFSVIAQAAQRYLDLIAFMNSRSDRNLEWDLTVIDTVLRDFRFVATPSAVLKLCGCVRQLQQELTDARSQLEAWKRECADMTDVMAVSGSGNVITLPLPRSVTAEGLDAMTIADITQWLSGQGFEVREVTR
jgi:hypothetical protein